MSTCSAHRIHRFQSLSARYHWCPSSRLPTGWYYCCCRRCSPSPGKRLNRLWRQALRACLVSHMRRWPVDRFRSRTGLRSFRRCTAHCPLILHRLNHPRTVWPLLCDSSHRGSTESPCYQGKLVWSTCYPHRTGKTRCRCPGRCVLSCWLTGSTCRTCTQCNHLCQEHHLPFWSCYYSGRRWR